MAAEEDSVSTIQDSVDRLALSMFDALRLIPLVDEAGNVEGDEAANDQAARSPMEMDDTWRNRVKELANGVVMQAKKLEGLIEALPGADLSEEQQLEELSRLDAEGRKKRSELANEVKNAEQLEQEVNAKLDKLSGYMLGGVR
ncbi:unnamed protein product [Discosporangium mesarthrocarpum]